MAEELQGLLDRIQSEGIAKAEAEKTKIVEDAKAEAAKIVAAIARRLRKRKPLPSSKKQMKKLKSAWPKATTQSNRRRAMCSLLSAQISRSV